MLQTEIGRVYADTIEMPGKKVYEILSIPYATAGRLEYPELIDTSGNTADTVLNREGTYCFPQRTYPPFVNIFMKHHMMRPEFQPKKDRQTEDAFTVNIWTEGLEGNRPVLVFIHGGGEGSGTVPLYTMPHIAEHGIVAVSVTYRIGNFGYMPAFDGDRMMADLAYFDQQTALMWIHENIRHFGGDPGQVTLMGHCGGAIASLYHFLNPVSSRLFSKLILCCANVPVLSDAGKARDDYRKLMEKYRLNSVRDLKALPVEKFRTLQGGMNDVVDGNFFAEDPLTLLKQGKFPQMPVLIGSNADDFSMIELPMYYKFMGIAVKEKDLDAALEKKYGTWGERLKEAFRPLAGNVIDLQTQIMELMVFHSSSLLLLDEIGRKNPVYGYRLTAVPNLYHGLRGAYHGAELAFFFGTLDKMGIKISEENRRSSEIIQEDWLNFIRTGKTQSNVPWNSGCCITEYGTERKTIVFPQIGLLRELEGSGLPDKIRREYIENR